MIKLEQIVPGATIHTPTGYTCYLIISAVSRERPEAALARVVGNVRFVETYVLRCQKGIVEVYNKKFFEDSNMLHDPFWTWYVPT